MCLIYVSYIYEVHSNDAAWIAHQQMRLLQNLSRPGVACTHLTCFAYPIMVEPRLKLQSVGVYLSSTKAMKAMGTVQASLQSLVMKSRLGSCDW